MSMELVETLKLRYPSIRFQEDETFMWLPAEDTVFFDPERIKKQPGVWSLLHELGHALARHTHYERDLDLIKLEMQAWRLAKQIAQTVHITIDEEHVQDCLDSYRDWLHTRSRCPECSQINPQDRQRTYTCFNCKTTWKVSSSQLCSSRSRAD